MPSRSYARRTKLPSVKPRKPYRLKGWRITTPAGPAHFFSCARPGRTSDDKSKYQRVSDETVHRWVEGLRCQAPAGSSIAIVSLLGRKNSLEGDSEFSFYSFCGELDTPAESDGKPTFQEWIDHHYAEHAILVREHPTIDYGLKNTFPSGTLGKVKCSIEELVSGGYTIFVVDSGGETRTGIVSTYLQAKEDSSIVK